MSGAQNTNSFFMAQNLLSYGPKVLNRAIPDMGGLIAHDF
jgi:hypothetical protein